MWEWRIYYERDFKSNLPDFLDFSQSIAEERTDYYYDFSRPQYGLKERLSCNNLITPKLELKIRYDQADSGAEYWVKVMSKEFQTIRNHHLAPYQIEEIIQEEIGNETEFSSDIEYFNLNMPSDVEITKIHKRRWEIQLEINQELIDFEYVELTVNEHKFYGFSMESENLETIELIINKYNIDNYQLTGGYPTLINAINQLSVPLPIIRNQ